MAKKWSEEFEQHDYDFEALERELTEPSIKPHMQRSHIMENDVYVTLYDGKRIEDFTTEDSIAYKIDTDIALNGRVLPDLEEAIEKAGYQYSFEGTKIKVSPIENANVKEPPVYLRIPAMEREDFLKVVQQFKDNGAKFNPFIKRWYLPPGVDKTNFEQYIPDKTQKQGVRKDSGPEAAKTKIAKGINQTKKYQANRPLVENIYSLNQMTGKEHSVEDLAKAYKSGAYQNNPDADKLMQDIGKEFIRQEQVRAIAP